MCINVDKKDVENMKPIRLDILNSFKNVNVFIDKNSVKIHKIVQISTFTNPNCCKPNYFKYKNM